ncbi:hypothetical protein [Arthrobacter luteolus]
MTTTDPAEAMEQVTQAANEWAAVVKDSMSTASEALSRAIHGVSK